MQVRPELDLSTHIDMSLVMCTSSHTLWKQGQEDSWSLLTSWSRKIKERICLKMMRWRAIEEDTRPQLPA